MKKGAPKRRSILLSIIGVATAITVLTYFAYYSIGSQAKGNKRKKSNYYWCTIRNNGATVNQYCYGNTNMCQTYTVVKGKPKNKNGVTFLCYPKSVTGCVGTCPVGDFNIIAEDGARLGCFGGHLETNPILKEFRKKYSKTKCN
jgi:hypothetical protein